MSEMGEAIFKSKKALPNKLMQEDGSITDMLGNPVTNSVVEYDSKAALPNKWMNPDGSYSTLNEIIAGAIDTDLFIVVQELPATGEDNKIYLVPKDGGTGFVEWIYADGQWDTIGELEIDLSNYPTIEDMQQYVNEKIAQQSFGWTVGSGSFNYGSKHSSSEILNMWNEIQNSNKITDVFVFVAFSPNLYIFKIDKNALNVENTTVNIRSINQTYNNTNDASDSRVMYGQMGYLYVAINASGKITSVTTNYDRTSSYGGFRVLLTDRDYSTPYTPQYDGSPATKKYVDDIVADNAYDGLDVYYISGPANSSWDANSIAQLQKIIDTGSTSPCMIVLLGSGSYYTYYTTTHQLSTTLKFTRVGGMTYDGSPNYGYGMYRLATVTLYLTKSGTTITAVSPSYYNQLVARSVDPGIAYGSSQAFIPTDPGHPATKKYVDDAIATNITTMLNGNY